MAVSPFPPIVRFPGHFTRKRPVLHTSAPARGGSPLTARRPADVGRPTPRRPSALVTQAIATAFEGLAALEQNARDAARAFRWRRVEDACGELKQLVRHADEIATLATTVAAAVGADFDRVCEEEGVHAPQQTRAAIADIVGHQTTSDWSALAETLERDFVAAVLEWREAFEALSTYMDWSGPTGTAA